MVHGFWSQYIKSPAWTLSFVISTSAPENAEAVKRDLKSIPCCLNAQFRNQEQSYQFGPTHHQTYGFHIWLAADWYTFSIKGFCSALASIEVGWLGVSGVDVSGVFVCSGVWEVA